MSLLALLATTVLGGPELEAVRLTTIDFRPALRLLVSEDVAGAQVGREGDEVVVRVIALADEGLALPAVEPPLLGLRLERAAGLTRLRVRTVADLPYEASREPGMVTVIFGAPPSAEERGPVTAELYGRLFPTGAIGLGAPAEEKPLEMPGTQGLALGRLVLRPYASASWVDADVGGFGSPEPVRDRYLQVQPGVTATLPVGSGLLAAEYEPRLRFFSDIPAVSEVAHFAGVRLEMPLGSRTLLRVGHRFTRAVLETTVVDPGREYFFDLSPFWQNETTAGARFDVGPRLTLELDAGVTSSRFEETQPGGFFDFGRRTARAGVGYDLGSLRATVSYGFERIPPSADRPVVESMAHTILGMLSGDLGPLMTGSVTVGLRTQSYPQAEAEGDSYTGITLGGSVQRTLGAASTADLSFTRTTLPSAFEQNAFYLTNSVRGGLTLPAPFATWLRAGAGYLWNDYRLEASGLGEPRSDRIFTWSVGAGRSIGWRMWVRADYWRDDRRSNVPGYDVTTDGFMVQLGAGVFGPSGGARP